SANGRWRVRWLGPVRPDAWARRSSRASKGQVSARKAERHATIIGAGRIEVECEMRIDGMSIAELPLQCSTREEPARTAGGKQQRYRLGAQIHGKSSIAPQASL